MKNLNINEIDKLNKEDIIDVREVNEYKERHIPGVKNIPMNGLILNADNFIDKDRTYYIMCRSGGRSEITVGELKKLGYDVVNLEGGISGYNGEIVRG